LQATVLDRSKPLWEIYFVDGLEGGDIVAIVVKVHHAMGSSPNRIPRGRQPRL